MVTTETLIWLIQAKADLKQALEQLKKMEKALSLCTKNSNLFTKALIRNNKEMKELNKLTSRQNALNKEFATKGSSSMDAFKRSLMGAGFGLLFQGMAIQRFFLGIGKSMIDTYMLAEGNNNTAVQQLNQIQGAWEYIKWGIADAFMQSSMFSYILDLVMTIAMWFSDLPDTTKKTISEWIVFGIIVGTVSVIAGMFVMTLLGILETVQLIKLAFGSQGLLGALIKLNTFFKETTAIAVLTKLKDGVLALFSLSTWKNAALAIANMWKLALPTLAVTGAIIVLVAVIYLLWKIWDQFTKMWSINWAQIVDSMVYQIQNMQDFLIIFWDYSKIGFMKMVNSVVDAYNYLGAKVVNALSRIIEAYNATVPSFMEIDANLKWNNVASPYSQEDMNKIQERIDMTNLGLQTAAIDYQARFADRMAQGDANLSDMWTQLKDAIIMGNTSTSDLVTSVQNTATTAQQNQQQVGTDIPTSQNSNVVVNSTISINMQQQSGEGDMAYVQRLMAQLEEYQKRYSNVGLGTPQK